MSSLLGCDQIYALGIYAALCEIEKEGILDSLDTDRLIYELGFMSQQMSRKLSQLGREKLCEVFRETKREKKREDDRERQREYYRRKRAGSLPPTPSILPVEKEREEYIPPVLLRNTVPRKAEEPVPDTFETFWNAYPKKKAKQDAIKAWKALRPSSELTETIIADIDSRLDGEWRGKDRYQFIPYPATYLRGKRWEDESEEASALAKHRRDSEDYSWDNLPEEQREALRKAAEFQAEEGRYIHSLGL